MGPRSHFPGVSCGVGSSGDIKCETWGPCCPLSPCPLGPDLAAPLPGLGILYLGTTVVLPVVSELHKAETLAVGPTCLVFSSRPPHPNAWVPMLTDTLIHMNREYIYSLYGNTHIPSARNAWLKISSEFLFSEYACLCFGMCVWRG